MQHDLVYQLPARESDILRYGPEIGKSIIAARKLCFHFRGFSCGIVHKSVTLAFVKTADASDTSGRANAITDKAASGSI